MNILVCEDNKFQAQTLVDHLKTLEYIDHVDVVNTGEAMISAVLEKNDITAIFLDIDLPDMNGLEVYGILKMRGKHIPAVLITGMKPLASDTYHLDIIDVIEKPYLPPRVEEALRKIRLHIEYQRFIRVGGMYVPIINDKIIQVVPDDILFFESCSRGVKVHIVHDTIEAKYIPLKVYEEYLRNHGFVFSHRAFLVNTNKIAAVNDEGIFFKGEKERKALVAEERSGLIRKLLRRLDILPT